jgi:hypothetical protein
VVFSEIIKEQRRKEYAQKQKMKLASYQNKIKTEAEKIQVQFLLRRKK